MLEYKYVDGVLLRSLVTTTETNRVFVSGKDEHLGYQSLAGAPVSSPEALIEYFADKNPFVCLTGIGIPVHLYRRFFLMDTNALADWDTDETP